VAVGTSYEADVVEQPDDNVLGVVAVTKEHGGRLQAVPIVVDLIAEGGFVLRSSHHGQDRFHLVFRVVHLALSIEQGPLLFRKVVEGRTLYIAPVIVVERIAAQCAGYVMVGAGIGRCRRAQFQRSFLYANDESKRAAIWSPTTMGK
jgi:hypothetical protein